MVLELWSAYDELGEHFVRHAESSAYNAYYDRPAVLSALGEVRGRRVLDAACGPGVYAEDCSIAVLRSWVSTRAHEWLTSRVSV
jgi:predicted nicotinamide N-methyase